ncbi:MAG: hypothetical protein Q8Q09_09815 [Deltaproteobacteria bacterium]|nr:hypothetical protein [Deltaproteobacteria bacterium]
MREPRSPSWFIALSILPGTWYSALPSPPPSIQCTHPEDLHCTVVFLGTVSEHAAYSAWDALVWPLPTLALTLGPVIPLGNPSHYSALGATLAHPRERIERAMASVRDPVCEAAAIPPERRDPLAHITLARPHRRASDHDRAAGLAWAQALTLDAITVTPTQLALYTHHPTRTSHEAHYLAVQTRDL